MQTDAPIWRILDDRGLTLAWLAHETGWSYALCYAIKTGRREAARYFQISCSGALDLPVKELFLRERTPVTG